MITPEEKMALVAQAGQALAAIAAHTTHCPDLHFLRLTCDDSLVVYWVAGGAVPHVMLLGYN